MLEIYISGRNFSPSTPLTSILPSNRANENLHVILIDNQTYPIISSFWTLLFNDKRLKKLSLIHVKLNQNDALLLEHYLNEPNHLTKLIFDSIQCEIEVFNYILTEGLQRNLSIKSLTLSNILHLDISIVVNLIETNQSIEYLSLNHNKITSDHLRNLSEALKMNTKIKSIDLSENLIDETGVLTLLRALEQRRSSLHFVNLIDNQINSESQQLILQTQVQQQQQQHSMRMIFTSDVEPLCLSKPHLYESFQNHHQSKIFSIIFVTFLFFLWGVPHQLNDVLIRQFMKLFVLSRFEAGLVQSAFFMGYFVLALPSAYVLRRWGYKLGIILGFLMFGTGSFLFWPAALTGQYPPFLLALFVIAMGLAFLETAANPYIANSAGPMETSEKRLNLAQAFNPLGAITGGFMGSFFIFSQENFEQEYLKQETLRVVQPYAILGGIAFLCAIIIAIIPFPTDGKTSSLEHISLIEKKKLSGRVFLCSILAQFVYVGAQVGTWSYFLQYIHDSIEIDQDLSNYLLTGTLALFALGRLTAALFLHLNYSASMLLFTCALCNICLICFVVFCPNMIGISALFFTSFFMGPMFPTIFALGIKNMNESSTKLASCFLVMACIGGALYPSIMDFISMQTKRLAWAYLLPGITYVIVGLFALIAYKQTRKYRVIAHV